TESDNALAVGVKSRDILGTTAFSLGYAYNPFESSGYGYGRLSFQGLFPIIDLEAKAGNRRVEEKFNIEGETVNKELEWNEQQASVGIRLPFNFTHSKYFQSLVIGSKVEVTNVSDYNFHKRGIDQ